ncbi:MAG: hypothetical protein C0397_02365 [Odoribacter sp.]|nr:hypothetical protein [Odoribacter sp.]
MFHSFIKAMKNFDFGKMQEVVSLKEMESFQEQTESLQSTDPMIFKSSDQLISISTPLWLPTPET